MQGYYVTGNLTDGRVSEVGNVLVLADDIFFLSKIRETAQRMGVALTIASSCQGFEDEFMRNPSLVIVDLNMQADVMGTIAKVRRAKPEMRIIGFVSHVQTDLAERARNAGCSEVMARSKFTQELANILEQARAD